MTKPSVTVLIPTYNRAHFLAECLDSVLGQTIPPAQVIVINDGSTDNTREVLAPYMDRIEYIEKENGGKSTALNLAMPRVRGDYVWIIDDDDVAVLDAMETHLCVLENDPSVGFTYTACYYGVARPEDGRLEIVRVEPLEEVSEDEFFPHLLVSFPFHQATMLVRASCYRQAGPFDVRLVRSQDYEMMVRLGRRFKARAIPRPTVSFRQHAGQRGSAADRFDSTMRHAKIREYDRIYMAELRRDLALHEYLPKRFHGTPLRPRERRRAYLQRAIAMAYRGLYAEMLEDLRLALSQVSCSLPLSLEERAIVPRGFTSLRPTDPPVFDHEFTESVRLVCTGRAGQDVKVEIARVLLWHAEGGLVSGRLTLFVKAMTAIWRLLRAHGLVVATLQKLREAFYGFHESSRGRA